MATNNTILANLFEKLRVIGHQKVYDDLHRFQEAGWWEGGRPEWVSIIADTFHCGTGSNNVITAAWEFVAEEAMDALRSKS